MTYLTFLALLLFAFVPQAQAEPMCPVYTYTCLPEVNHVSIEKHHMPCWKPPHFQDDDAMRALADKGIYMPWPKLYGKEELIHTCEINGREVKIKMDAEHFTGEYNIRCWEQYNRMMRTTWWLDGEKVVDNVGFIKDCQTGTGRIGNYLDRIEAKVYRETKQRADITLEAEVFDFDNKDPIMKRFSFRLHPPYDHVGFMSKPPITNADIH